MKRSTETLAPPAGILYEIRVGQHLDPACSVWLAGLTISNGEAGTALLRGYLADQAALYGVLQWLRDFNIPLLDMRCADDMQS